MSRVDPDQRENTPSLKKPLIGVLLIHGLNGSRHDMKELHELFVSEGMVAENMLLPGHGTRVSDMFSLGWPEWASAVRTELAMLKQRCDVVFLVGHSLGGALSLHVAAHEEVAGVISMCAPLHLRPVTARVVRLIRRLTPVLPTIREDVRDPAARRLYTRDVYRWTPLAPVESMMQFLPQLRAELPHITVPTLVINAIHDHVVPAHDGREIYRLLGSKEKHLVTLHRSFHVVMKDHDREEVFAKTLAFIHLHASKAIPHQKTPLIIDQTA